MRRIVVSVINDLVTDQRVHRICTTLHSNGYEILLIGRKLRNSLPVHRNYQTHRFRLLFNKGFLFYGCYNLRLFFFLLFKKCNVLLANDLDTLPANFLVSRLRGKKLVFDSHEYFPEVPELIDRKRVQSFWLSIEKWIVPGIKYAYTVSPGIAKIYHEKYGAHFQVIRNLPMKSELVNSEKFEQKTIIYQGALNIGRGIELMIETLNFLPSYRFIIAGDGDITDDLKSLTKKMNLSERVDFLGSIPLEELKTITPKAHLGISLEEDRGLNYRFALPNKLFDYIQANIPVIVSCLPEMKSIVKDFEVGEVLMERKPEDLAQRVQKIVEQKAAYYKKNLQKAAQELCWENEEMKLLNIFRATHD